MSPAGKPQWAKGIPTADTASAFMVRFWINMLIGI
jgi:hypothetical protein